MKLLFRLFFLFIMSSAGFSMEKTADLKGPQRALNQTVLSEFRLIVKQQWDQEQNIRDITVLNDGLWYPVDYILALNMHAEGNDEIKEKLVALFRSNRHKKGLANSRYFYMNRSPMSYFLKDMAAPSEAITNLSEAVNLIDSAMAIQIAFYRAILKMYGEKKFDAYFSNKRDLPMLAPQVSQTMLADMCDFISPDEARQEAGAVSFVYHHLLYSAKNLFEPDGQYFMVESESQDNPKYIGFGLGINALTLDQIKNHMINKFNYPPKSGQLFIEDTSKTALITELLAHQRITSLVDENIWDSLLQGCANNLRDVLVQRPAQRLAPSKNPLEETLTKQLMVTNCQSLEIISNNNIRKIRSELEDNRLQNPIVLPELNYKKIDSLLERNIIHKKTTNPSKTKKRRKQRGRKK